MKNLKLWMAITADEYELPLAVGKSGRDLAKSMGLLSTAIWHLYSDNGVSRRTFNGYHYKVITVEVENETESMS